VSASPTAASGPEQPAGTSTGALDGLRVLDLSRVLAGPLAAQILADLGADVIKAERPDTGDDSRSWAPPFVVESPRSPLDDSVWTCNRGKRSIAIDLASQCGRSLVARLAAGCDVLIENYKTGTLERYGLGFEALSRVNPVRRSQPAPRGSAPADGRVPQAARGPGGIASAARTRSLQSRA
jgi:crotonobetainyl-CoA:carnitine CoA-transferase CaiB-like acyl-CoA transferase